MLRHTTLAVVLGSLVSLVLGSLIGCQPKEKTAYSGFLRDYSTMMPSPIVEGAVYDENPVKRLDQYDKFMIDPVVVHFAPNAQGTALDPAKLTRLTDYFRDEAIKALSKRYTVVKTPGPGVLRIRAAITDIQPTKPLMNIHPASKLMGAGLGGASMEAEAIDSQTKERVFAVVDTRQGDKVSVVAGLDELGHAKQVMNYWIGRFVKRVDEAHGHR